MAEHGAYYGVVCNAGIIRDGFPALTDEWDGVLHPSGRLLQPAQALHHADDRPAPWRAHRDHLLGVRADGQPGPGQLQRRQGGHHGRHQGAGAGARQAQDHGQLRGPGLIDTGMVDEEVKAEALKLIPLKRMGQADEVAGLVSYLMSDIAGYVTRQVISINGGMV